MALTDKLTAIADAIRDKTGEEEELTLDEMATAIEDLEVGGGGEEIPDEIFEISSKDLTNFDRYGRIDGILNYFKDKWSFTEITGLQNAFAESNLQDLSWATFYGKPNSNITITEMFYGSQVEHLPKLELSVYQYRSLFSRCFKLKEITDNFYEDIDFSYPQNNAVYTDYVFRECYLLKSVPKQLCQQLYNTSNKWSYSIYSNGFYYCYNLRKIEGLPVNQLLNSGNASPFSYNAMLEDILFDVDSQNNAKIASWKGAALYVTYYIGYFLYDTDATTYAGLSSSKRITDATSYGLLKDDEDSWTTDVAYAKYNHDSAVRTINSLPDTSAYLTANGGTNTITFLGNAGSATDGGAINTLTPAEIAVATAKGWTVTIQ